MLKKQIENEQSKIELIKSGQNFLGILNDIKRRPEDAAKELGVSLNEILSIIGGKKPISEEIIKTATKIWPVNARDFYIIEDDCSTGTKIMKAEDSLKSSRIMERADKPYYEYRDTVMSKIAPFRPEWIMELCRVDNNDPNNSNIQWNNGHFMHQFTYFIGEVNFYFMDTNGEKNVAVTNTGDSMYITPFVPHSFATRDGAKENGLILALTYGGKLTGDTQQELSSLSMNIGSEFALDFTTKERAFASLLKFLRGISNFTVQELSKRTEIQTEKIHQFENAKQMPSELELSQIAQALNVNIRDLLPNDKNEEKVIVKKHSECKKWYYPENSQNYEFIELASTTTLPFSKAFELTIFNSEDSVLDISVGLHQYIYNIGDKSVKINWTFNGKDYQETLNPDDSAYVKPFIKHNFRGEGGKLLVLGIGGKIIGDSQRELSFIGKENAKRAISETIQWFNPEGKN